MTQAAGQVAPSIAAQDRPCAGAAIASLAFLLAPLALLVLRGLSNRIMLAGYVLSAAALPLAIAAGVAWAFRIGVRGDPRQNLRRFWMDLSLIPLALAAAALAGLIVPAENVGPLRQAISELYLAFACLRAVQWRGLLSIHPVALVGGVFVVLVLVGAGLLCLPGAVQENTGHMYFIDALFTSTGAVCATALPLRDTARDFTTFGQAVILGLVQIGGYLFMLFGTALAVRMGRRFFGDVPSDPTRATLAALARPVGAFMLAAETIGTLGLCSMFYNNWDSLKEPMGAAKALWYAGFHSVSAFCNAGYTLYTPSMSWFRTEWQVLGLLMPLTIIGGLGYPVLKEFWCGVKRVFTPNQTGAPPPAWLSTQARMTLGGTWMLIVFGALVLMLLENVAMNKDLVERAAIRSDDYVAQANWSTMTQGERLRESVVQSVAARSSGLHTLNIEQLSDGGKMTLCTLMLAGGGQGGTAGGIKLAMVGLLLAAVGAGLRRQDQAPAANRAARAVVAVVSMYLLLAAVTVLLLCVSSGSRGKFMDCVFEATSACASVGWSSGLTPTLNVLGKSTLIGAMFLGRLGPAMLLWMLTGRESSEPKALA